jgi:hypothetical protein
MRLSLAVILLLVTFAPRAYAQQTFLERRVDDELAADGVQLSQLDVRIDVELVADKALVSLVDITTGRVRASTKLDDVPRQHEAAVASIVLVASSLVTELGPLPRAVEPPSSAPLLDVPPDPAAGYHRHRRLARAAFWTSGLAALATLGVAVLGSQYDRDSPGADMRGFNAALVTGMVVTGGAFTVGVWHRMRAQSMADDITGLAVSGTF